MPAFISITIDGPAASGKSSAGLLLAQRLGFLFFDTGVMYRVITWAALDRGMDLNNEEQIKNLATKARIDIAPPSNDDGRINDIFLDGIDITMEIRNPDVNQHVSQVSAYFGVREALTKQQRSIASKESIVMAGRDIGTIVLPDATFKFYLEASVEVRAARRKNENNDETSIEEIMQSIIRRDKIDSGRSIAPLRPAEDAIIIHTDQLTLKQVVDCMYKNVVSQTDRARLKG